MRTPPASFLRLRGAFRRRRYLTLLTEGDAVARQLEAEPGNELWTAEVALMMGSAHASYERVPSAITYLEYGLALTARESARRDAASRRRPDGGANPPTAPPLPGAPTVRGTPTGATAGPFGPASGTSAGLAPPPASPADPLRGELISPLLAWSELLLVDLLLQTGAYAVAAARVEPLLEPGRAVTTRFAATRAQAALTAARGDHEGAHHLLNTGAGLAARVPSRFRAALVEGDRAALLAVQGRGFEATTIADRVLGQFVRPLVGEHQVWSNAEGAAVALTVSRHAAIGGDQLTARRMLAVGERAAAPLARSYLAAHVDLARGVVADLEQQWDVAEAALIQARQTFERFGYRPGAAITALEQGRLAHRRGLLQSAGPLYETALAELRDLGQPREAAQARSLLASLAGDRSPA